MQVKIKGRIYIKIFYYEGSDPAHTAGLAGVHMLKTNFESTLISAQWKSLEWNTGAVLR